MLGGLLSVIARAAPVIRAVAAKVAPVVSKITSPIVGGISALVSSAKAAPVKAVAESKAASFAGKGIALGSVAVGSYLAGGAQVGKIATGSAIAAAGAGTGAGLLVGATALANSARDPAKVSTQNGDNNLPKASEIPPGNPNAWTHVGGVWLPPVNKVGGVEMGRIVPSGDSLQPVKDLDEKEQPKTVTVLEEEVRKVQKDISALAQKQIGVGNVTVGDVGKIGGAVGAIAAGTIIASKLSKKKKKAHKASVRSRVPKSRKRKAAKKKATAHRAKKSKNKLKFGSPAWRKKYMKKGRAAPAKKKRKGMKGSGSYYEIEAKSHGLKTQSGYKITKIGTEKQYDAAGGKKVLHDSRGRPYIKLESGMHRYIKSSK